MISVSRNPILTKLFVVLLALAFVLAPVASAQHCGSVTGVDCTYEHAVEPDESEDHTPPIREITLTAALHATRT